MEPSSPSPSSVSWGKRIQIALLALLIIAGFRLLLIFYARNTPAAPPKPENHLALDDYVVPTKLHAFDLKSLRGNVRGKTIWVQAGNQMAYYPCNPQTHSIDFKHTGLILPPLAILHVADVITAVPPGGKPLLMLVFTLERADGSFAVSTGEPGRGESGIFFDQAFLIEDPRQLYKHWPADVWDAVSHHQIKPGMNEFQSSFAMGPGRSASDNYGNRTIQFENDGKSVQVTFENNQAVEVKPAR